MKRLGMTLLAAGIGLSTPVAAAEHIAIGYTIGDSISAFAAKEEGYFAKRGLDVDLVYIALNSNIPAGIVSGSLQAGMTTVPVVLQTLEGGLNLVAFANASILDKAAAQNSGIVVRTGLNLHEPKDFVGKKVGVPGIGAVLDILFRNWLMVHGVDPSGVTYVETTLAGMGGVLRSGSVDAVIALEPVMSRMVADKSGTLLTNFAAALPDRPIAQLVYVTSRDWADAHKAELKSLQAAIAEGADFTRTHPDKAREYISKYTKLPLALLKTVNMPSMGGPLTADQMAWWYDLMQKQHMLKGTIDLQSAVVH
jgi:NitT/TauT family transport system substrate-binding protein